MAEPIRVEEAYTERDETINAQGAVTEIEIPYLVFGVADESAALAAAKPKVKSVRGMALESIETVERINGTTWKLSPVLSSINGYVHWTGSGNVYYTQTYGWVYMSGMFPGYEPLEEYDYGSDDGRYTGDSFYALYSFPTGNGGAATLSTRGRLYGGETREVTAKWERWTAKRGEFGEYEPKDGAEGAKWLGLPRFRGNGEYFVRSFGKTNGHFTYGRTIRVI